MTLTEFLLARIAEDETLAQKALDTSHDWVARVTAYGTEVVGLSGKRVLAECEAKRRIVERETGSRIMRDRLPWGEVRWGLEGTELLGAGGYVIARGPDAEALILEHSDQVEDTPTLRDLAAVYADHPDYDETWRP